MPDRRRETATKLHRSTPILQSERQEEEEEEEGDPSGKTRSVRASYLGERFPFPGGNARYPRWMLGCPPMA